MDLFKLVGTIAINNAEANKALEETQKQVSETKDEISNSGSGMTGTFKKVGAAVATYFTVDAVKNFGLGCIGAASDANAASSQFTQVFGDLEGNASKSLISIADEAGISENRMKGSFTKIAAFAKTTGMDTEGALALSERAMVAVADSAAFYDQSLEDTTERLQSFLKGNYENDAALGLSCTETTRNAAANELYGKSFKDLSESQKQLTLLQMVEDANATSGALGQAARESDTWTNQTGNLKQAWTDLQAVLGANVLPKAVDIIGKLASGITSLVEKMPEAVKWFQEHKTIIQMVAIGVGTLTTAITAYNAAQGLKNIAVAAGVAAEGSATVAMGLHTVATNVATAATSAFGAVMSFITSPITLVVVAIGALIAIGVLLYKNWDTVKEKCAELGKKLSEIWGNIKNAVSKAWENIKNAVKVGIMFVVELISAAFQLITLPWRFIWENCKEYIVKAWNSIKNAVSTALNFIKNLISKIWSAIANALSPILSKIQNVVSSAWNSVKSKTSAIFSSVKSAVSNAINTVKSTISAGLNSAKSIASSVLDSIKSKFSSILNGAATIVKNAISKIKGFFNFNWSLPKLKMPHFSLKGKFSLSPPSVPKLSVSWYKKAYDNAMILNDPAIFGYSSATGNLLGGGDGNGGEVVSGASTLMNMIQGAVAEQNSATIYYLKELVEILATFFPQILEAMDKDLVLDSGVLVGELAVPMNRALGKLSTRKDRGR